MENRTFSGFYDLNGFENQYETTNPYQNIDKTTEWEHAKNLAGSTLKGAATGATTGAAIGSAVAPGPGTAIGAGIGWVVGGIGGGVKGLADIFSTDRKEADLSKQAEKFNAALDEQKYAQLRARQMSNDIKSSQVQSSLAQSNMNDYLTDIQNPY